jgi:hypothetical protein
LGEEQEMESSQQQQQQQQQQLSVLVRPPKPIPGCLSGRSSVFTDEMLDYSREEAHTLVKACGGMVRADIIGKTSYLVIGKFLDDGCDVATSVKYQTAQDIINGGRGHRRNNHFFYLIIPKLSGKRLAENFFGVKKKKATSSCKRLKNSETTTMTMAAATTVVTSPPTPTPPSPEAIAQLISMGFKEQQVKDALRKSKNNIERAANMLLIGS